MRGVCVCVCVCACIIRSVQGCMSCIQHEKSVLWSEDWPHSHSELQSSGEEGERESRRTQPWCSFTGYTHKVGERPLEGPDALPPTSPCQAYSMCAVDLGLSVYLRFHYGFNDSFCVHLNCSRVGGCVWVCVCLTHHSWWEPRSSRTDSAQQTCSPGGEVGRCPAWCIPAAPR